MLFKCYFVYHSIAYMLTNRTGFLYENNDQNPLVSFWVFNSLLIGLSDIFVRSSYLQSLVLLGVFGVILMSLVLPWWLCMIPVSICSKFKMSRVILITNTLTIDMTVLLKMPAVHSNPWNLWMWRRARTGCCPQNQLSYTDPGHHQYWLLWIVFA